MPVTTTYMGLTIPDAGPSGTAGPTYATMVNTDLSLLDAHDHSPGKGTTVPSAGIGINADLGFNGFNLKTLRALRFSNQSANLPPGGSEVGEIYVYAGDLWYISTSGAAIQLTSGSAINFSTAGAISGMGATTAAVTYTNAAKTFSFTQAGNQAASIDGGKVTIREQTVGGNGVTLQAAAGQSAYNLTFPAAAPAASELVWTTAAGQLGFGGAPVSTTKVTFTGGLNLGTTVAAPATGDLRSQATAGNNLQVYNGTTWLSPECVISIGDGTSTFGDFNGTDQVAFTNAIAALPASGGRIIVKRGTYTFTAKLTIAKAGVTLEGESREATIITGAIAADSIIEFNATDVVLRDLTVKQTQGASANFVVSTLPGADRCGTWNCHLEHTFAGINTDAAAYNVFRIQSNRNKVFGNRFVWTGSIKTGGEARCAIMLLASAAAANVSVEGNEIVGNSLEPVANSSNAVATTQGAIIFRAVSSGAGKADVTHNVLVGNSITYDNANTRTATGAALYLVTAAASTGTCNIQRNTITGNAFYQINQAGSTPLGSNAIILDASATSNITNNSIVGNVINNPGITYQGAAPPAATANSVSAGGLFVAASSGGAVTTQLVDNLFNLKG